MFQSFEWPAQWKVEYVTPIGKIPEPQSEDDLRPISCTNFFSKVAEHFVVDWLLEHIGDKIDFRQYGGSKGNSITHYIIELLNFILSNQEASEPTAALACLIDFSKAFNRQNHNVLVTKLCDMGAPSWLLKIVMSFLKERSMVVRYKDATSKRKMLPGGGPQGTLLGLLLFLVLINDAGFTEQSNNAGEIITSKMNFKAANEIHLKYVDDMLLAEAINLKQTLEPHLSSALPANFRERTGHTLPQDRSRVYKQLLQTVKYADENDMKINFQKTKLMIFNNSKNFDFMPHLCVEDSEIEVVEESKLLGLIIRSDLKWTSNTDFIVKKAFHKLWILRRLKQLGTSLVNLVDIYIKRVRSVLELAVPAWHPSLTKQEGNDIERVQRAALQIILGPHYKSYNSALEKLKLETLEDRRKLLCKKFAVKAAKHPKHRKRFVPHKPKANSRYNQPKFRPVMCKTRRFEKSPLSYLTQLLNKDNL